MEGRPLDHLELLSIAKKDEDYFQNWVGNDVHEITQRYLGVRRWIQFRNAITVLSRLGYFTISTLTKDRTLGEEFCDAQATNSSLLKNLLMVILNNELRLPREIPKLYSDLLLGVHYVTFFLFGDFYELAKRVTNHTYITGDNSSYQSKNLKFLYRLIGCGMIVKIMFNLIKQSHEDEQVFDNDPHVLRETAKIRSSQKLDIKTICHLCSDTRIEATSTLCGHIFCWDCIHRWLKDRGECPICRTPTEPSRLIHLMNFK